MERREFLCGSLCAASGLAAGNAAPAEQKNLEPRDVPDEELKLVACCGLYCGLCSGHGKIPKLAARLVATLKQDEYDKWALGSAEGKAFWKRLNELAEVHPDKGCRTGKCGAGFCAIRTCAKRRNVRVCPECEDYPCKRIHTLAASETTLLHDGGQIRKVGLEEWIAQQKRRAEAGFCYSDIRCIPCTVPKD